MNEKLIEQTATFVKQKLQGAETGHDWFHTERVWKTALKISEYEGGDPLIISLAALLHDIADPKFHDGDEQLPLDISAEFLQNIHTDADTIDAVLFIIKHISFKNRSEKPAEIPLELRIVQDADRLDAIGAIGIARTFNFGGFKNNPIYDPDLPAKPDMRKEEYKKSNSTTINHFHEKLLLLKDLMNTDTARQMAQKRHDFMLVFLKQFHAEWEQRS